MASSPRTFLIAGERHTAELVDEATAAGDAAFAYGVFDGESAPGWTSLGPAPLLERPLRLRKVVPFAPDLPLLVPFGRKPKKGFREITAHDVDPRLSRLWGRFSVDVRVAIERDAKFFGARVWQRPERGYRVFIVEDGDRYAIRAACVFSVEGETGHVVELLHDRTVEGMRGAAHVLGQALRAMSDAGAGVARAFSLPHAGASPMFLLHGFTRVKTDAELRVRANDPAVEAIVTQPDLWYASFLDFDDV